MNKSIPTFYTTIQSWISGELFYLIIRPLKFMVFAELLTLTTKELRPWRKNIPPVQKKSLCNAHWSKGGQQSKWNFTKAFTIQRAWETKDRIFFVKKNKCRKHKDLLFYLARITGQKNLDQCAMQQICTVKIL